MARRGSEWRLTPEEIACLRDYVSHMKRVKPDWEPPSHILRAIDDVLPRRKRRRREGLPVEVRQAVLARDGHKCFFCKATDNLHIHHMIPRSKGGTHDPENLLAVCEKCHAWLHEGELVYNIMVKRLGGNTA